MNMASISKSTLVLYATLLGVTMGCAQAAEPRSEDEKTLYALGLVISQNLANLGLSNAEWEMVRTGLNDGILKRSSKVDVLTYGSRIAQFTQKRAAAWTEGEKKRAGAFVEKAASEPGVLRTPSGGILRITKEGTGPTPAGNDTIRLNYRGTYPDGTEFDSSYKRGEPSSFSLNSVIKCWNEGLQMFRVGGKGRLVCPADIAYGERGLPPVVRPSATLVFEVELLGINP